MAGAGRFRLRVPPARAAAAGGAAAGGARAAGAGACHTACRVRAVWQSAADMGGLLFETPVEGWVDKEHLDDLPWIVRVIALHAQHIMYGSVGGLCLMALGLIIWMGPSAHALNEEARRQQEEQQEEKDK